jgi:7,8-dihydro-6-hydroxymethylpterin dimethyltransferase
LTADQLSDASQFFLKTMTQTINPRDMFRITTTSFMDAWNFDIRQLMKECVHFVLPSGHIIPFSAYNVLYRNGKVPLPELQQVPA